MKRFKIFFSKDYYLGLTVPVFNSKFKLNNLVKVLFFSLIILFSLFLIILPSGGILGDSKWVETNIFKILISFTLISFVLYFSVLVLNGKKRIIDPPLFLNVLVFALLITVSGVITPTSTSNTFGLPDIRTFSGIFTMCSIGIFYLINVLVNDKVLIKRFIYSLSSGLFLYLVVLVLSSNEVNFLVVNNIINISLLFIFLGGILLFSKIPKIIVSSILFISFITVLLSFSGYSGNLENLYIVLVSFVVTSSIFSLYFLIVYKEYFKNKALEIKNSINIQNKINLLFPLIVISIPLLAAIFTFIIQAASKQNIFSIFTDLNVFLTSVLNSGFKSISLVGLGSNALSSEFSLFVNITNSLGLLGLIAYLFLAISTIYFGFKLLKRNLFVSKDYKIIVSLLFILIYIIVISFFIYPGILIILFGWICLGLLASLSRFSTTNEIKLLKDLKYRNIDKLSIMNGKINFQYILLLVILGFAVIIYSILFRINF